MLSIKNSLASVLLLASYAAAASQSAPGQSAINLQVESCSKENTGSANAQGENVYQTLGLCNDHCQGKFAYAVLQYQECWCSNDKPSETVSVDECNQTCPGYPGEKCGNKGAGLYAYVPLDGAPISSSNGTSSASSSTGSVSPASNATMPGSSTVGSGSHSTSSNSTSSAGGKGNGNGGNGTSSDGSDDFNSASSSLSVSSMGAAFGFAVSCAFAFAL